MNLEEMLMNVIANEGKAPLTDQQLADHLGVTRETVNTLRNKKGIPSYGKRLMEKMMSTIPPILKETPDISVRNLQSKLQKMGYNVSTSFVHQALKELKNKQDLQLLRDITVEKREEEQKNTDIFSKLVGYDGSLKNQIVLAKAAVRYPPKGLDTILLGQSGVGKSYMAKCMYKYAVSKGVMEDNKLVIFNCADYANNVQLLCSHLFGHVKGAFTGAERDKIGLISLANGGMLFLDEVHRLPPEGQEMLFNIIDNGVYRRLGETEVVHNVNVMIVAATTEDIDSNLLATFRRRIPMIIELPPLNNRSLEEKYEFVKLFLGRESKRIKKDIEISHEACCALLCYDPVNNIGQMESDIKVAVAKAYLKYVSQEKPNVGITLDMLPIHICKAWLDSDNDLIEQKKIVTHGLVIHGDNYIEELDKEDIDIYKYIDDKWKILSESQLPHAEVQNKLAVCVENKINEIYKKNSFDWERNTTYYNFTDPRLLTIIEEFLEQVQSTHPELLFISSNIKYSLGFHLQTMVNRLHRGLEIIHPGLTKVKEENKEVYNLASNLVQMIRDGLGVDVPEDEIGYICMYLNSALKQNIQDKSQIGIIVACHGRVASSMLEVAEFFNKGSNAVAIDMCLDEKPTETIKLIAAKAKEVDSGHGVLLLTDMGSLAQAGPLIAEETGINIETLTRVDTVMLMEAMYWSQFKGKSLLEIKNKIIIQSGSELTETIRKPECILIYCVTGIGAAKMIGEWLKENFVGIDVQYKIIYTGLMQQTIEEVIAELQKTMTVRVVIGNVGRVNIPGVKFFTCKDIYHEIGIERLRKLLGLTRRINLKMIFSQNLVWKNPRETNKKQILYRLASELNEKGAVGENFTNDIWDREEWVSTYVGSGIAFPHTVRFDNINYSQVAIAVYDHPIDWDGFKVNVVCMLAIKQDADKFFKLLYERITRQMNSIKMAANSEDILHILLN